VIRFTACWKGFFKRNSLFGTLSPSQPSLNILLKIQLFAHHAKSQRAKTNFPYAKAIDNADSWACFAVDMAGYMPESDRNSFLK